MGADDKSVGVADTQSVDRLAVAGDKQVANRYAAVGNDFELDTPTVAEPVESEPAVRAVSGAERVVVVQAVEEPFPSSPLPARTELLP